MRVPRLLSISYLTGLILAIFFVTSLVGMLSTIFVIEASEGDAEKINVAGSLRMFSMKIALAYKLEQDNPDSIIADTTDVSLSHLIAEFETRLHSDIFSNNPDSSISKSSTKDHADVQLKKIRTLWSAIRINIQEKNPDPIIVIKDMNGFVAEVDQFVTLIQERTESKLNGLKLLQNSGLLVTVILATGMMVLLRQRILHPLRELVIGAEKAQSGDFSYRINHQAKDELGVLANTFNNMADSLGKLYNDLESQVSIKTNELRVSNASLHFLNQAARALANTPNSKQIYQELIDQCREISEFDELQLTILGISSQAPIFSYRSKSEFKPTDDNSQEHRINLQHEGKEIGFLLVANKQSPISNMQQQLLDTFADIISKAFGNLISTEREHRLLLVEERATIGRELHDSIAQSLSFLKMQMARLSQLLKKKAKQEEIEEVGKEVREGINIAYQQLREVLTTFRLKSHEPGLRQALSSAVSEYSQRADIKITLDYQLQDIAPSANEEMHISQIVREALNNIIKHANASEAHISLNHLNDTEIQIQIKDNGQGMPDALSPFSHGLAIMNERASQLSGYCKISSPPKRGTTVEVVCKMGEQNNDGDIINPFQN